MIHFSQLVNLDSNRPLDSHSICLFQSLLIASNLKTQISQVQQQNGLLSSHLRLPMKVKFLTEEDT